MGEAELFKTFKHMDELLLSSALMSHLTYFEFLCVSWPYSVRPVQHAPALRLLSAAFHPSCCGSLQRPDIITPRPTETEPDVPVAQL